MASPPLSAALVAPCGMNCGVCRAHLRERNPCRGCNLADQNRPKTRENCHLRLCGSRTGPFCFDCAEYPCARLERLDARYRARYGMSEVENLEFIRDHGLAAFVELERRRYVTGESVRCVHDGKRYRPRGG